MTTHSSAALPPDREGWEYADALVTAMIASDDYAALEALRPLAMDRWTRDALLYLAGSVAHMWEQSCDAPLEEWAEALTIRAAQRLV